MATLSLTTHFTVDIPDDDSHTITGGSTTATDSITITHYFDRRYSITNNTLVEVWNDTLLADFDFLWIESNYLAENDTWETNWTADTIDRIECYNSSGSTANVRVFAAT